MKLLGQYTQQHDNIAWRLGGGGVEGGWRGIFCRVFYNVSTFFTRMVSKDLGKKVTYRHCTLITAPCSQRVEVPATVSLRPVRKL